MVRIVFKIIGWQDYLKIDVTHVTEQLSIVFLLLLNWRILIQVHNSGKKVNGCKNLMLSFLVCKDYHWIIIEYLVEVVLGGGGAAELGYMIKEKKCQLWLKYGSWLAKSLTYSVYLSTRMLLVPTLSVSSL